jgi:hypothetical protein
MTQQFSQYCHLFCVDIDRTTFSSPAVPAAFHLTPIFVEVAQNLRVCNTCVSQAHREVWPLNLIFFT